MDHVSNVKDQNPDRKICLCSMVSCFITSALFSMQELQATLNKLKGSLTEMTKLNAILAEGASRERQTPLKGEMTDIDKKLENVAYRLNAKLTDLEATIAKWNEYYKRLNNFCDWLNEKEAKLAEIYDNKQDTPEEQLQKAEVFIPFDTRRVFLKICW